MPASSDHVPGVSGLRGSLAGRKRLRMAMMGPPARTSGNFASPVHELQGRLRRAFAFQAPPEDRAPSELDEAIRQARTIHRANAEGMRTAILSGALEPASAARWISAEVETCITSMLTAARQDLQARTGGGAGGLSILGMGKLGGRELSLSSDVDLMFVCEPASAQDGEQLQALVAQIFSALAWSPASGRLYDLDMRLRPFGTDGPLATPYALFSRYYRAERWTWELQALLRARVIGDDSLFGRRLAETVKQALCSGPPTALVLAEVADMRRLMAREQPAKGPWDLKHLAGGLTDLEFIVQGLQLAHAARLPQVLEPGTAEAIEALREAELLAPADAVRAAEALRLYAGVRQLQGALRLPQGDLKLAASKHHGAVLRGLEARDWPALRRRIASARSDVRRLFQRTFGISSAPRDAG